MPRLSRTVRTTVIGLVLMLLLGTAVVWSSGSIDARFSTLFPTIAPDAQSAPAPSALAAADASPAPTPSPVPASPPGPLAAEIDQLLERWQADRAFWGISVINLKTGDPIYQRNAGHAFLPASNQKIITTATALDVLGPTYRYETALRFSGETEGNVMRGDLILDGSGDPTFGSSEVRGEDPLRAWAERLANMGVKRIEGRLIGDDNRFDDRPYPEGWDVDYITKQAGRYMGTSAGGLSYKDNVVSVRIAASRPGARPNVRIRPDGAVSLQNESLTSRRWRGSTLQVDRLFDSNKLVMTGSVARSYRGTVSVPVSNPTTFALNSFVTYLRDAGIETALTVHDIDDLDDRAPNAEALFVHLSPPLSEIVAVINKQSNNFYAEQVFRTYGWGGSTRGASRRTDAFLRRADIDTDLVRVYDGSGLSRKDLATPGAMVQLLRHMNDHSARDVFRSSLAGAGENNTTLEHRLRRAPVFAKTGSLRYVRALSGYALRPDGTPIAFSIFANNYTGPSYQITRTIDDVVRAVTLK
ncbi:D-alanyl-D-alanine carboxypeptidase/D-alanyl-D-alanine endopeptidase [Longibacter salinarum]|nr:D-alanyl-D-alanine carboxypeptidase/D-alanyl-D-alanine-endopeptidase [Longibacter salinarum]